MIVRVLDPKLDVLEAVVDSHVDLQRVNKEEEEEVKVPNKVPSVKINEQDKVAYSKHKKYAPENRWSFYTNHMVQAE